jgi:hypothetical protein
MRSKCSLFVNPFPRSIHAEDPFERAQERAALTKVIFCPPDEVYHNAKGALVLESTASQPGLPEYFVGTRLCDRWSIERFIQAGSFGRGWVARDHKEGRDVFIKTFRCWSDRQYIPSNKAELKSAEATHERGIKKEIRVRVFGRNKTMMIKRMLLKRFFLSKLSSSPTGPSSFPSPLSPPFLPDHPAAGVSRGHVPSQPGADVCVLRLRGVAVWSQARNVLCFLARSLQRRRAIRVPCQHGLGRG